MSEPIAGANIWRPVMERAGYQCECLGVCGKHRGRCDTFHSDATRLAVTEFPEIYGRPWAMCGDCYDRHRRKINSERPEHPPQEGLF